MVNEAIASFGQLLNSNYEKGCYFLDELDRDTGFALTAEIQEWKVRSDMQIAEDSFYRYQLSLSRSADHLLAFDSSLKN